MITSKSALINYRLVPNGTAFERYERAETVADFYDARLESLGSLRYRSYVLRPAYPAWSNGVVSAYWALTLPEEYYQDGQTWPVYVIEAVQH